MTLAPKEEVYVSGPGFDFLMLTSGCAYWLEGDTRLLLESGQLLVVERVGGGCLRGAKYECAQLNAFTIRLEWLQGVISFEEQLRIGRILRELSPPALIPKDHAAARTFHSYGDQKRMNDLYARTRALEVLALLLRGLECGLVVGGGEEAVRNGSCEEKMERLIREIPLIEMRDLSMSHLAETCGCRVRHAGRVFRQLFGKSLRAMQVELQMDQATEFLSIGGYTVERVADLCGYADAQHFRVAFRRRFGMAPTDWRNEQRCQTSREGKEKERTTRAG